MFPAKRVEGKLVRGHFSFQAPNHSLHLGNTPHHGGGRKAADMLSLFVLFCSVSDVDVINQQLVKLSADDVESVGKTRNTSNLLFSSIFNI